MSVLYEGLVNAGTAAIVAAFFAWWHSQEMSKTREYNTKQTEITADSHRREVEAYQEIIKDLGDRWAATIEQVTAAFNEADQRNADQHNQSVKHIEGIVNRFVETAISNEVNNK